MSLYPVGLLVALFSFAMSIRFLNQSPGNYFDAVAALIVFGGTVAVFLVVLPWDLRKDVAALFRSLFIRKSSGYRAVVSDCLDALRLGEESVKGLDRPKAPIHMQLLADGFELHSLGFTPEKTESILAERLNQAIRRRRRVANAVRGLAKYPPAFGLMGTVLGLVNVMRGVSAGLDGRQTSLEMAVALVATMYGLIVANLLINPAGEMAMKESQEMETAGEIAITSFRLWTQGCASLEAQETLNSFVPPEHRVSPEMPAEGVAA